jgi:hypothetical protein
MRAGPNLWIDNMDDARGVLDLFKEYFEDEGIKKVLLYSLSPPSMHARTSGV